MTRQSTVYPCPPWCTRSAGHPFDSVTTVGELPCRIHSRDSDAGDLCVDLVAIETLASETGPAILDVPALSVWIGGNVHESHITSATDARTLARLLCTAADRLDAITGS